MTKPIIRVTGHFGELMQGCLGPQGPLALITLPCPVLSVSAVVRPAKGLRIQGAAERLVTLRHARKLLDALKLDFAGRVILRSDMPAGGGAGASTAALVALARAAGWPQNPVPLAEACQKIEGATDPLMFRQQDRLLWASREARVIEELPGVPAFDLLGGFCGPPRRTNPRDDRFPDISDLIEPWKQATVREDLPALATLCTQSAKRTLQLRGPREDPTLALADSLGALGIVIAHTGSARGFIFAPGMIPQSGDALLREAGFTNRLQFTHTGIS